MEKIFSFLKNIPTVSNEEIFQTILQNNKVKIERIVSFGQTSQKDFWYNQNKDECVLVLDGSATIEYDDGSAYNLNKGDFLYIGANQKHKVTYTQNPTVWLAVWLS
ncbi:MAG: cupin domain-containing protein [Sulfurospirillaceae bacterium]|nr:cupin domain-containing protein [Sulfurospirillaceae bacterium]MDD3463801.1 cupin domain-containing protein [Sulfurospirillaceae bacterium]